MVDKRAELQAILEGLDSGVEVYFQPPESVKLTYPCIIYEWSRNKSFHASNKLYSTRKQYTMLFISKTPNHLVIEKLIELPYCSLTRRYVSDNLYHTSFDLYY